MEIEVKEQLINTAKQLDEAIVEMKSLSHGLKEIIDKEFNPSMSMSIHNSSLNFSVRALNVLDAAKCSTVFDIVEYGVDNLINVPKCGKKTVNEIKEALLTMGVNA